MYTINLTNLEQGLLRHINNVTRLSDSITVTTNHGNAVILHESEYKSLVETCYINSIPGFSEKLIATKNAPNNEFMEINWQNDL